MVIVEFIKWDVCQNVSLNNNNYGSFPDRGPAVVGEMFCPASAEHPPQADKNTPQHPAPKIHQLFFLEKNNAFYHKKMKKFHSRVFWKPSEKLQHILTLGEGGGGGSATVGKNFKKNYPISEKGFSLTQFLLKSFHMLVQILLNSVTAPRTTFASYKLNLLHALTSER